MRKINLINERNYENRKARGEKIRKNQDKYYWATSLVIAKHKSNTINLIKNKNILEIGCSCGDDAIEFSKYSSFYCGIDISDEAIKIAKKLKLENSEFLCGDGHEINKSNGEFDCVIVNSLLHHLDLKKSFFEINRILKPGGILIFREPLGTNLFFQLYRSLTPLSRTEDERPFTLSDLRLMNKFFDIEDIQWFGFTSIVSAFIRIKKFRRILTSLDNLISRTFLKYFFWQFCGFAKKKELPSQQNPKK